MSKLINFVLFLSLIHGVCDQLRAMEPKKSIKNSSLKVEDKFKCMTCNTLYASKKSLQNHKKTEMHLKNKQSLKPNNPIKKKKHACLGCNTVHQKVTHTCTKKNNWKENQKQSRNFVVWHMALGYMGSR